MKSINRNLDGYYFRVLRDGKWTNVCFTDLHSEEVESILRNRGAKWLQSLYDGLKEVLNKLFDTLNYNNISTVGCYKQTLEDIKGYNSLLIRIYMIRALIRMIADEWDIIAEGENVD